MNNEPRQIFSFAGFELDAGRRRLVRDGEVITLHAKPFDLLSFLVGNAGRVVSRDDILDAVWNGQFVKESNLTVQSSVLRKVLQEQKDAPRFPTTVPGKGYKFIACVYEKTTDAFDRRLAIYRFDAGGNVDDSAARRFYVVAVGFVDSRRGFYLE